METQESHEKSLTGDQHGKTEVAKEHHAAVDSSDVSDGKKADDQTQNEEPNLTEMKASSDESHEATNEPAASNGAGADGSNGDAGGGAADDMQPAPDANPQGQKDPLQATENTLIQDFFSLLRQKESERLFEYAAPKQIVWKGGVTKDVYFIYDGDVEVYDEAGVIFHLHKNDHFGEIEVFHDLPRLVHARAVRTSSILVLPDAVFEDYMVMNPEVKRFISHTARQRFSIIQERNIELVQRSEYEDMAGITARPGRKRALSSPHDPPRAAFPQPYYPSHAPRPAYPGYPHPPAYYGYPPYTHPGHPPPPPLAHPNSHPHPHPHAVPHSYRPYHAEYEHHAPATPHLPYAPGYYQPPPPPPHVYSYPPPHYPYPPPHHHHPVPHPGPPPPTRRRKVSMGSGSRGYVSSESTLEEPDSTEARIRRAEALQQELDSSE